jgi:uncharacterized membrane protein YbhN (UPF0104 family)
MRSGTISYMWSRAKVRKIENLSIQLVILIITYLFIYYQVFRKNEVPEIFTVLEQKLTKPEVFGQFFLLFIMMILNWSIEAIKWKRLISKIENVSFYKALQGVLTGISISSFTPNRVGEFFGRAFILKKASHIEGILITVLGSMSQLLVTILTGTTALLIFLPCCLPDAAFSHGYLYVSLFVLLLSLDILLLGLFFNISFLGFMKEKFLHNRLRKVRHFFRVFAFYRNRELLMVLLLSMVRYLVFSTQFYFLLRLFEVPVPYFDALLLISLTFFIMAVIPTIALTELGIRGSVALYVFGLYLDTLYPDSAAFNLGIFSASAFLWLINLGVPALIGTFFVFSLKFFRKGD